jgi:hypothetical protein
VVKEETSEEPAEMQFSLHLNDQQSEGDFFGK